MTLVTDSITYNLHERGRKHVGIDRKFDLSSVAKIVNSPAVQERVKNGDMLGYFGHWPRLKFGMQPPEGAVVDGKVVNLPVALKTVELHADEAGNITHRAEFLDTEAGQVAAGLYRSKAGGFSSAIDAVPRTSPYIARGFYGFDYVYEPNYATNRGHSKVVLDSVGPELVALLDGVLAQAAVEQDEMASIFDSLHAQHLDTLSTLERVSQQNDEMVDLIAKLTGKERQAVLDSMLLDVPHEAPGLVLPADPSRWSQFREAQLEQLSKLPDAPAPHTVESRFAEQKYGFKG